MSCVQRRHTKRPIRHTSQSPKPEFSVWKYTDHSKAEKAGERAVGVLSAPSTQEKRLPRHPHRPPAPVASLFPIPITSNQRTAARRRRSKKSPPKANGARSEGGEPAGAENGCARARQTALLPELCIQPPCGTDDNIPIGKRRQNNATQNGTAEQQRWDHMERHAVWRSNRSVSVRAIIPAQPIIQLS